MGDEHCSPASRLTDGLGGSGCEERLPHTGGVREIPGETGNRPLGPGFVARYTLLYFFELSQTVCLSHASAGVEVPPGGDVVWGPEPVFELTGLRG